MKKPTTKQAKDPNIYPPGLNYKKAKAIADYYDSLKAQDVFEGRSDSAVWMEIPKDLVPKVRRLIAGRKKSA